MDDNSLKSVIDKFYEKHIPATLKLAKYDIKHKESTSNIDAKMQIIQSSLKDLSNILIGFYSIWLIDAEKPDDQKVYGDLLLAFIGDKVIRQWPNKELLFQSRKYVERAPAESGIKEHKTPISFFRDLFVELQRNEICSEHSELSNAFYYTLANYYRVIEITKDEDKILTKSGNKSRAFLERYNDIEIYNQTEFSTYDRQLIESVPTKFSSNT